ncbi:MAG: phosphomannomutase, partial [Rhodospirillales bacterium]|nr:phosphomannomutase [Rhodospirillales bacterium]
YDDALYAALRMLSIAGRADIDVAAMRDRLPQTVNTPEMRFPCPETRKFAVIDEVKGRLAAKSGITVHDIDGVRVQSDDGWWLLRASNTQDVLVARCEAADAAGLDRLKAALVEQVEASGLKAPEFD